MLDNIATVDAPGRSDRYCYDDGTNRLTMIRTPSTSGCSSGAATTAFSYDWQGNVTAKNNATFEFDFGNRLRTATNSGTSTTYVYDALGRRVRDITGSSRYSLYTQAGQVAYTSDARKRETVNYIYLGGSLVATSTLPTGASTPTVRYQHTDALGTPVVVTDASRAIVEKSEYAPYGAVLNRPKADGIGFTGHVEDAATGLTYMQQRYYDPAVGRFLSVDPVETSPKDGLNFQRYWYASNNPVKNTDPDGRCDDPSTCAIDRDIAAMNHGEMSRDEFMERSEARGAGALGGIAVVATGYLAIQAGPVVAGVVGKHLAKRAAQQAAKQKLRTQAVRGIRSLQKRIAEHEKKLAEFKESPTVRPGMEGMSDKAIQAQQATRIEHLEKEIKTFKENIKKLEKVL